MDVRAARDQLPDELGAQPAVDPGSRGPFKVATRDRLDALIAVGSAPSGRCSYRP